MYAHKIVRPLAIFPAELLGAGRVGWEMQHAFISRLEAGESFSLEYNQCKSNDLALLPSSETQGHKVPSIHLVLNIKILGFSF